MKEEGTKKMDKSPLPEDPYPSPVSYHAQIVHNYVTVCYNTDSLRLYMSST